ncbi:MAG: hypothetical protein DCF32_10355 [Leptolyngbya sp.]|nr:MAG: hypothetical protein DCF32_10355 [Leptolyngbya sp.]
MARSGFVLPTTVLLVIMVVLTATALTYRSFTRSDIAISQREQQVIANAATPALDRARAKIEFLFKKDTRYTSGLPTGDFLASMMLDLPYQSGLATLPNDPFTLPGETRLDINNDDTPDNAWSFVSDANGETIVYSILVDDQATPTDPRATTGANLQSVTSPVTQAKANALITRTGPQATTQATTICSNARAEKGWQVVSNGSTSALQKNFQINVFVPNANNANRTVEAFEFQQSRIANRGNKWAAWFRYDLEIYPGAPFTINGAMHTDSSLMATGGGSSLTSYKISSHRSCVYSKEASEITVGEKTTDSPFEGQVVHGVVMTNSYNNDTDNTTFHIFDDDNIPITNRRLTADNDSVSGGNPADVAVNPLKLFTEDKLEHTNASSWSPDNAWANNPIFRGGRIFNKKVTKPFVDDFSRADNRWGPKPRYSETDPTLAVSASRLAGSPIDTTNTALTDSIRGLDGFWERQAVKYGLRLIVGERLQLGNPVEWNRSPATNTITQDRLYPPDAAPTVGTKVGANEYRQKRALRDNLAAVQSMVVYHYKTSNGEFPAACMAMTAHPGSRESIINSRTFGTYPTLTTNNRRIDFLKGTGTNGWEFQFPSDATTGFNTPTKFAAQIANDKPLGIALRNLARFSGDPKGGAPYFTSVQDNVVHPAPYLTMWGDFSPLRRIFTEYLDASPAVSYEALSAADKATLHSAACTVSMLAYNIDRDLAELDAVISTNTSQLQNVSQQLGASVVTVMNCLQATPADKAANNGGCKSGNFNPLTFLKTRGDIDATNNTVWVDPNINTVITDGNLCPATGTNRDLVGFQANCDSGEYFKSWRLTDWTAFINLPNVSNSLNATERAQLISDLTTFSQRITTLYTTVRDRDLGFRKGNSTQAGVLYDPSAGSYVSWNGTTGSTAPVTIGGGNTNRIYGLGCDPNIFQDLSANGVGGAGNNVMLGLLACSELQVQPIKYPSLYYLFPLTDHDHDGTGYHQQPDANLLPVGTQVAEPYITDNYVKTVNPTTGDPPTYRVVGAGSTLGPVLGLRAIAAVPRSIDPTTWTVPAAASTVTALDNPNDPSQAFVIATPTSRISVPFLDKGIFNGREQMAVRALDIDLNRLTTSTTNSDYWIPDVACNADTQDCDIFTEGIVYAAREDAVREDEIVRPAATANASSCLTVANITSTTCRMVTTPGSEKDPPLTRLGISLKPVDFVADPDRRPHGFRLRNGDDMSRNHQRAVGMTLVTDNSVYIQGDFNRHFGKTKNPGAAEAGTEGPMEEFTATVGNVNWTNANFYTNRTQANLNENFALARTTTAPSKDRWRPVEILADAVTILSNGFIDGDADDTFTIDRPGSAAVGNTSYMNQSRPNAAQTVVREGDTTGPVFIDRNGNAYVGTNPINLNTVVAHSNWTGLGDNVDTRRQNTRAIANDISVNALFIAGIVPSRPNQGYGGLHNFPRLIENWDNRSLNIAGSFFQLNFATASTGPFEHDAWEPSSTPASGTGDGEKLGYYSPPTRRWGYDPALLYYPPAAAARRFVSVETPRSEYFRELPANDPYIANLRCARNGANFIFSDPDVRGTCPA